MPPEDGLRHLVEPVFRGSCVGEKFVLGCLCVLLIVLSKWRIIVFFSLCALHLYDANGENSIVVFVGSQLNDQNGE